MLLICEKADISTRYEFCTMLDINRQDTICFFNYGPGILDYLD